MNLEFLEKMKVKNLKIIKIKKMNIEGKLVKIFDLETGISKAGKEWKKQSILLEQDTQYNKEVVITFTGDKISKLKQIQIGDNISCNVNISSREYNGKWYHNINAWTCATANGNVYEKHTGITGVDNAIKEATNDDLPF